MHLHFAFALLALAASPVMAQSETAVLSPLVVAAAVPLPQRLKIPVVALPQETPQLDDRRARLGSFDRAAPFLGQALDAASTLYVLQNRSGVREGNPVAAGLLKNKAVFVATKLGVGLGASFVADYAARHGRPRTARWFARAWGLIGLGIAAHNLSQGH